MKHWVGHKLAFLGVVLLWACSGGVGGAVDGGGTTGVGGPVGGGNFAAGPMSLPAPTIVAPNNPVEWVYISCTNVVGPNVECKGNTRSVPPNTEIQFSIFAPAAAVARDTFTAVAGADGSWLTAHAAAAGESIEICPKVKGTCQDLRYFKIPPEGSTVDGSAGTMKNFVIDSSGNSWHSRLWPRGFSFGTLLASLWIPEARAETAVGGYTPVICPTSGPIQVTLYDPASAPPADPSSCSLFRMARGDPASASMVNFDDCEQTDIHAIISTKIPLTGAPILLVAVKNRVYVVDISKVPTITWTYTFPDEVAAITDQGGGRFILAAKVAAATTGNPRAFYYLDIAKKAALGAGCYSSNDFLRGLETVTSSDSLNDAFAMVVYNNSGNYQVFAGRTQPGVVTFHNQPMPISAPNANPLEVKVLNVEPDYVYLAVLNGGEKKITLIKHYFPSTDVVQSDAPADVVKEIGLEGLALGAAPLSVSRPQLFNANRDTHELVFLDIGEQGSRLITLPYNISHGDWTMVTTASAVSLGNAGPAFLRHDDSTGSDGGWAYNDGSYRIQRVRTTTEQFRMQFQNDPELMRIHEEGILLRAPATDTSREGEE